MAFAGRIVYADRRRDVENDDRGNRRSSTRDSADANASEEAEQQNNREQKAFLEQAERLLACPCLDDLKQGPCGEKFKNAFRCFILSKEAEKGAECAHEFTRLEMCMDEHKEEMFKKAVEAKPSKLDPKLPRVPVKIVNLNY